MLEVGRALFSCAPVKRTLPTILFPNGNNVSGRMNYSLAMLSPKAQCRLANAKKYFEEHLCAGDYYSEGEKISGHWFGKGAESLYLDGAVKRDEFLRLCDNLDPVTGERLT